MKDTIKLEDMSQEELISKVAILEAQLRFQEILIAIQETAEDTLTEEIRDLEDQVNMGLETIHTLKDKVNELLKASDIQESKYKQEMDVFYGICLCAISDLEETIDDAQLKY